MRAARARGSHGFRSGDRKPWVPARHLVLASAGLISAAALSRRYRVASAAALGRRPATTRGLILTTCGTVSAAYAAPLAAYSALT